MQLVSSEEIITRRYHFISTEVEQTLHHYLIFESRCGQ